MRNLFWSATNAGSSEWPPPVSGSLDMGRLEMIARIWKGAVRRGDADDYARYMEDTGLKDYTETPGNRGVYMLRRDAGDLCEFMMFTVWDSIDSIKEFAGDDVETAVFYPEDERFLVERDLRVTHFTVDRVVPDPATA